MGIFQEYKAGTLDLISSDYTRPEENSSGMLNVLFEGSVEDPRIEKRLGAKRRSAEGPMFGIVPFTRIHPTTGVPEKEVLGFFKDRLKRRKEATLDVSYSGAAAAVTMSIFYDPTTSDFRCKIVQDGVTVLNHDLGLGYDEGSPVTIAALDTAISALSGFTASTTGTSTIPAAFLELTINYDLKANAASIKCYEWESVTAGTTTGVLGYNDTTYLSAYAWSDQAEAEKFSWVALNNVLYYYASGNLYKYDGKYTYLAGMDGGVISSSSSAAGSIPDGTYNYKVRYINYDAAGNIVAGPWSDAHAVTLSGGPKNVTLNIGSTAYGYDDTAGSLKMEIARTNDGGVLYYTVALVTKASTYVDSTASLSQEADDPEFDYGPPPAGNYVAVYKGGLVCSGFPLSNFNIRRRKGTATGSYDIGATNDVWFGDYENIEGFPTDGSFTVSVQNTLGDDVRGMRENGDSLIVFKDKSVARLSGDPTQLDIKLEWMSKEVGCLGNHTIQEIGAQLMFLSTRGFAVVSEGRAPDDKPGYSIRPIVNQDNLSYEDTLRFVNGATTVLVEKQLYICFLPAKDRNADLASTSVTVWPSLGDGQSTTVTTYKVFENGNGRVFVFDYLRNRWAEWYFNAMGGICTQDGKVMWSEVRYSSYATDVLQAMFIMNDKNHAYSYQDHENAISWTHKTAWYINKMATVVKQWVRMRVSSVPTTESSSATLTVKQQVNFIDSDAASLSLDLGTQTSPFGTVAQTRLLDGKYRSTRFVLQNSQNNTNVQVEGWDLEVNAPYVQELKT